MKRAFLLSILSSLMALWTLQLALSKEFRFCVVGVQNSAIMRIIADTDTTENEARIKAEDRLCEITCGQICATLDDPNDKQCQKAPESVFDLTHAQSHVFCEGPGAVPRNTLATVRALSVPGANTTAETVPAIINAANQFLDKSGCPLRFQLGAAAAFPLAFNGYRIINKDNLKTIAQYPANVKFINTIDYCDSKLITPTLNSQGGEIIKECTVPDYSTVIVAEDTPALSAILLLRGYGHLAGIGAKRDTVSSYTVADPDLLIPSSPLLDGKLGRFHITRDQCIGLLRYVVKTNREVLAPQPNR